MSTLIDLMLQPVTLRVPTKVPDGEGGNNTTWTDGATIQAAITAHRASWAWIAEHGVTTDFFNVTTPVDVADLSLFDVIKDADGKTYRITSNVRNFPEPMSVHYKRYTAERWDES